MRDEAEAKARLDHWRRAHPAATHHCWAWRLGDPPLERSSDDGEPGGTAGEPMLRVLRGAELSDVLAVVVRWFGGTKLGKGGLARAYGGAVREALLALQVSERRTYETLALTLKYDQIGALQRLVRPPDIELAEAEYGERIRCRLRIVPEARSAFEDALRSVGIEPR